ncbi:hypothetical protein GWK26_11860 [haloarchaeon 3A1-DGR]|nr:hypothetical protein GWK26_11860 [haloarchaeon 3A1-DGR]
MNRDVIGAVTALAGNGFAWLAQSEEIWFSVIATYVRYIAPGTSLPDLRGPFLVATLAYLGFRLADLWDKQDDLDEDM